MANPRQRKDVENPARETMTGLRSVHGDDRDYGDRVAQRAYELYLERGAGDGRDFDDWLTAEREFATGRDRRGDSSE